MSRAIIFLLFQSVTTGLQRNVPTSESLEFEWLRGVRVRNGESSEGKSAEARVGVELITLRLVVLTSSYEELWAVAREWWPSTRRNTDNYPFPRGESSDIARRRGILILIDIVS